MDAITLYPLRIRVTDPIEIKAFKRLKDYRITQVEPDVAKRIGHKIPRRVKRDGIIINDGIFGITNPSIKLESVPAYGKRKGYDFVFKNII